MYTILFQLFFCDTTFAYTTANPNAASQLPPYSSFLSILFASARDLRPEGIVTLTTLYGAFGALPPTMCR